VITGTPGAPRSEALPRRPGRSIPRRVRGLGSDASAPGGPSPGGYGAAPPARTAWPPRSLRGIRILVVDDDENSADYFTMALRSAGATVTAAASAADALRALARARPDVVLSDIAMPEHDGYWLLEQIRTHAEATVRKTPVVATTAHGVEHARERALAAGFVEHLAKPVDPEMLCVTIARVAGH
jgi:CheY-like chemotaxis protein